MIDWLLVARSNNYGLTADTELVARALEAEGVSCATASTRSRGLVDRMLGRKRAKAIVHFERAFPNWFSAAERHYLFPNQERFPARHIGRLRKLDRVLAKTRHAEEIFSRLGVKTELVGFTSRDRLEADGEKRWDRFLHLAGGSTLKGTEAVLSLWARHPDWPELVLVQKAENMPKSLPANVTAMGGFIDDATLRRIQNECGFHLCPSLAEGWGHNIVEALSTGAVPIVTDAPPMNELADESCALMVGWHRSEPRHLGTCYHVDPDLLENAVKSALAMPVEKRNGLSTAARRRYLAINMGFVERLHTLLQEQRS